MDAIYNSSILAVSSGTSKFSSNLTSIISFLATIVGVFYFSMLLWVVNLFRTQPRVFKRDYSRHLQRYAPCELCLLFARTAAFSCDLVIIATSGVVYVFMVINSLVEAACASWLLVQYIHQQSFPDSPSRSALQLIIFCSCWTLFTAGFLTILFMHPTWSTHPVASVGSQTIWVIVTSGLWVAGVTILACELPAQCISVAYCGQIRALFAFSLLETIVLMGAMLTILWIVRQSVREALKRVSRQLVVSVMSSR
ncbi:uncharacterized protein C8R40DRAFT_543322 [Lentinula edodes]|uniref:uncharacterized protein n=1 Tax=Lentinula edodes TaxID=5353 RepID=UPI001E8E9062|nr:uncharacterized protein C8R40DRAFT_543322 [Lentinula edodes]KAH7871570.1 hypothetical protein C8R40DRAFT_543322 [Lentinula edodes]